MWKCVVPFDGVSCRVYSFFTLLREGSGSIPDLDWDKAKTEDSASKQISQTHTHLHDSSDLHQWNELGLYAVGQSAGQLSKESFIGPKLLQLLDEHRDRLTYSPEITNQVSHYHRTHLLIRPQWSAARRSRRLRRNWRGTEWGLASAGICPRRSTRSSPSAGNKAPVPGTVCSPLQGLYSNTHPHTHTPLPRSWLYDDSEMHFPYLLATISHLMSF